MKKIYLIALTFITVIIISVSNQVNALNTGTGYYGTSVPDYDIIYTSSNVENNQNWLTGGTKKYNYYTYYLYKSLKISTVMLNDNKFTYTNGFISGKYEQDIINIKKTYETSSSLGWEVIDDASISLSLTNYQEWQYRLSAGEEVIFYIDNFNGYAGIALIQLQIKIIERRVTVTESYGMFGVLNNTTISPPSENIYYFTVDYDFIPVFYQDLKSQDKNYFELINNQYRLKFVNNYVANFTDEYYNYIPEELKAYYFK